MEINNQSDQVIAHLEMQQYKTSHVLHLILSVLTGGLWVFVWLMVAASNRAECNKIRRRHGMPEVSNGLAWLAWLVMGFFLLAVFAATRVFSGG